MYDPTTSPIEPLPKVGRRIVIATHRRSGTHLAIDLLRRHFPACRSRKRLGEGLDALYLNLDRLEKRRPIDEARALALLRRAPRPIVKTHELPGWMTGDREHAEFAARVLADADVYCLFRDGRDVLCSLHPYTRGYEPATPASFSEFLRQRVDGVTRARHWADEVRACLALPGVRRLAFEEIVDDPRRVITRLGADLSLEPEIVEPLLPLPVRSRWGSRWLRLFSIAPEATSIPAAAAGRVRSWRDAFSREDRTFFRDEAGDLLIELGYERSDAWVNGLAA